MKKLRTVCEYKYHADESEYLVYHSESGIEVRIPRKLDAKLLGYHGHVTVTLRPGDQLNG